VNDELVRIEQELQDERLILRLSGEVDLSNVERLARQIDLAVRGRSHIVIDLSGIDYIDSQGLRLLKQLSDRFAGADASLRLVAPPGSFARSVLEMTLLDEDVDVVDALCG
jgi:anti-anti-sigma factor